MHAGHTEARVHCERLRITASGRPDLDLMKARRGTTRDDRQIEDILVIAAITQQSGIKCGPP